MASTDSNDEFSQLRALDRPKAICSPIDDTVPMYLQPRDHVVSRIFRLHN